MIRLWRRSAPTLATVPEDTWIKSPLSGPTGNCVEVMRHGSVVQVRDSKNPAGPRLTFTRDEWRAFVDGIQTFNLP